MQALSPELAGLNLKNLQISDVSPAPTTENIFKAVCCIVGSASTFTKGPSLFRNHRLGFEQSRDRSCSFLAGHSEHTRTQIRCASSALQPYCEAPLGKLPCAPPLLAGGRWPPPPPSPPYNLQNPKPATCRAMGKKSGKKDRAYITATEWRQEGGGHAGRLQGAARGDFRRLPFSACAISFQPFEDPVATADGAVFDIVNAVPYVRKFKRHPVTGEPLELKDLTQLHFHRNADGEYACPVLGKVFNDHTHIVALRPSGNVYCWEAVDQLCLRPKNMRDLLTDEPFTRADIIHVQDPLNLAGRNLAAFDHVVKELSVEDAAERAAAEADPMHGINAAGLGGDARAALGALGSGEAGAALAAGGGGKRAQAERMLAEAKAAAAAGGKGAGKTAAAAAASGGPDPRLRSAPRDPKAGALAWKPGTSTWNTDAPAAAAPAADGQQAGKGGADPSAGRSVPKPYSQRYVTAHTTTGAASRSLTSSSQAVATRNERTMVLQYLKPTKKG